MIHKGALIRIGSVAMLAGLLLTACSSTPKATTGNNNNSNSTGTAAGAAALRAAIAATTAGYKGTSTNVDPTPRPAAKNKTIDIISAGQAADSNSVPVAGAVEAAKAIGWKATVLDAGLNPSMYAPLVDQAIAAHVDGIILDAIDCDNVRGPLEQAKKDHIAVTAMYAFDCNDPVAHGGKVSLFDGATYYGAKNANLDKFTESYGSDQANYIIDKSHNTAKIIAIQDPEFTVLYYTLKGFDATIDASHGSQIVATLDITQQDILNGNVVQKIQAEVERYPDANWIKSPYTYATTVGIVPALGTNPTHISVMGGEGFYNELDDISSGKITATNAISSDWTGWASVDTLNSIFNGTKPVDSGIGWTLVDKTHNLPSNPMANYEPPINYQHEYEKAWGVG
jgi:ribose transport system substrate-binding protein